ncbi:hypothetical protein [Parabacteroides sp. PF5-6]|uniref:hypothetical protein n=1 Tax=Parabacteroides sp. PF5-6 TaxID=1742403 RepID=UPI0024061BE8|nr:hypothetical protein [Parabacteroides sp. PF5-6]MDF9829036.1 hypothetical protein [Parabacteroides sp. PF5-6]
MKNKISRKEFIRLCGSILAGGSILGVSAVLLMKRRNPNLAEGILSTREATGTSPYRPVSAFTVPDPIDAFALSGDKLIVAAANQVYIYSQEGVLLNNFAIGSHLRDIAVADGLFYLLFPARIEVYDENGEPVRDWEACSEESDYCAVAVSPDAVFVTDAAGKNICKYTLEGGLVRFIQSPNRFIVPSYSFGITYADGVVYCSNPGRHQVESYTPEGDYLGAFGQAGNETGMFCGCCNPVHLAYTSSGEIITSEKGNPRISCYSADGTFRNVLLDTKALGGGNAAYDVKVQDDKLFIAGKNKVSTFRYDQTLAKETACSVCGVRNCPLRKGLTI